MSFSQNGTNARLHIGITADSRLRLPYRICNLTQARRPHSVLVWVETMQGAIIHMYEIVKHIQNNLIVK